jgi:hypothetical protein
MADGFPWCAGEVCENCGEAFHDEAVTAALLRQAEQAAAAGVEGGRSALRGGRVTEDVTEAETGAEATNFCRAYADGEKTGKPLPGWRGILNQGRERERGATRVTSIFQTSPAIYSSW